MTKKAIVWIREDFRIEDNEALAIATKNHEFVNALYIYNPKNFDKKREAQKWWVSNIKSINKLMIFSCNS